MNPIKKENHFNYKEFGKQVKLARNQANLSTNQLGDKCDLDPSYIRQIESGSKLPSLPTFVKICNNLEVSPSTLLKNEILSQITDFDWNELTEQMLQVSPIFHELIDEILFSLIENLTETKRKKENHTKENYPFQLEQEEFGKRFYKAREEMQILTKELAKNCNISTTFIRQIESGSKLPSLPIFVNLCNELHVSPNYLLGNELENKYIKDNQKELKQIHYHMTPMEQKLTTDIINILTRNLLKFIL